MLIDVLGPLRVADGGQELELGPARRRALLALLVAAAGRSVGIDQLVAELWGEAAPPKVMASVQVHVANLRRLLEPDRAPRARPTRLVTRPPGYVLVLDGIEVDAVTFADEAARGRAVLQSDPAAAADLLSHALDLWRGDAYAGLAETSDLLTAEAARLEELRLAAIEDRAQALLACGRQVESVAELEPFVRQHPLRERAWGLLALALYRGQRQGEALEALRRARTWLAEELGVDPSPQLRELEAAILAHDPELAAPAPPSASAPDPGPVASAVPLGRAGAAATLTAAVESATTGHGRIVVITGEPGIGKTALARAGLEIARARGAVTGWGSWDEEGGIEALRPWRDAVGALLADQQALHERIGEHSEDLAPILPDRRSLQPADPDVDAETAGFRLADALEQLIRESSGGRPVVLALDDLHWADADSLRLLRRLSPAAARLPLVLILTSRTADADLEADVVATAATLARHDPVRIPLVGLSDDDVAALVGERLGAAPGPDLVHAVVERTDGNPFYIGEILRLVTDGPVDVDSIADLDVPDGVRDVVRRRLAALSETAREVLSICAVAGRRFAVDVVGAAATLGPDEVDDALDLALLHDLVQADDQPGTLRFSHALAREAIYAQVPALRRMRLHAKVAQSLERLRIGAIEAYLPELVRHFHAAGPRHARACWTYAVRAARVAIERAAYDEAARHYEIAVESLRLDPQSTTADEAAVLAGLGRVRRRQADVADAWRLLARAARLTLDAGDPVGAATIALTIAEGTLWVWRGYGEIDLEAIALWQRLLDALPAGYGGLRARVMVALAMELFSDPAEIARSVELGEEAVRLARVEGTDEDLLHTLTLAHVVLERPDRFAERLAVGEEQVVVARRLGRDLGQALCQRGTDHFEAGRLVEAQADLDRARALSSESRAVPLRLVSGWASALLLSAQGNFAGATALIDELDEVQRTVTMIGDEIPAVQRTMLARWTGTLGQLEPVLAQAAAANPGFHDVHLLSVLAAHGRDRVRELAGRWSEQPPIPFDYLWLVLTVLRARVWAELGDPDAVADLRATLRPYAGRWAVGGGSLAFDGIVDEALAVLAVAAGDADDAVARAGAAVEAYESRSLQPYLARALRTQARALRLLADPGAAGAADRRADELATGCGVTV